MAQVLMNVQEVAIGVATHKVSGDQIGTDAGKPVVAEHMQLYPPTGSLFAGRHTAATGPATALPANAAKWVTLKSKITNTDQIWIGGSGVTVGAGFSLEAGDQVTIWVDNTNKIFAISASTPQHLDFVGAA